jgi:hypothetical protein
MTETAWSTTAAKTWDEGILAGTGTVGAIVYGTPERHTLVLAHERFFVPANSRQPAPQLASALPQVREALAAGKEDIAADIVEDALRGQDWDPDTLVWTDPLGPIAQVEWSPEVEGWSDYRREISLTSGNISVSWTTPTGARAGLKVTTSHGSSELEIELWSEEAVVGLLDLTPVREVAPNASTVLPVDYSAHVQTQKARSVDSLSVGVVAAGVAPRTDIAASASLFADKKCEPANEGGWRIAISAGAVRRFSVRVETSAEAIATDDLDATALLRRSELSLEGASATNGPVEAIWDGAHAGSRAAEQRVMELAYAAGRRNIAISTGALPPTLQGVWQGTWSPAWSADYTMNGNVQLGALAAVLWTGTPELMRSLFRLVRQFDNHYRSNAWRVFGEHGMLLPARLTTHGHANHFLRDYPHQFWLGNGPWLLRLAADYVQVTGDDSIIDEWLWSYAVEILDFSIAVVDAGGGVLSPSYSPENTPTGRENPLATNAAADIAAIRDGLLVGVWLAGIRGDHARATAWTAARETLPGFAVAADGTLAEWDPSWQENVAHRHVSQLQGLWYEPDSEFLEGDLRQAAQKTVLGKLAWRGEQPYAPPGRMEMAFGLSSIALAAASLGDAESAFQCALWLARDHYTPALTTTHDAGAIFNLDASGALPAVIASMLIGSTRDSLAVLPALPRQWPAGNITGLNARGAVVVRELTWTPDGVTLTVELLERGKWLRPEGTRITMPHDGRLTPVVGVTQHDGRTLHIAPECSHARIAFTFTSN